MANLNFKSKKNNAKHILLPFKKKKKKIKKEQPSMKGFLKKKKKTIKPKLYY